MQPFAGLALRGVVLGIAAADLEAGTAPVVYASTLIAVIKGWRGRGQIGDFAVAIAGLDSAATGAAAAQYRLAQLALLPRPFADAGSVDTTAVVPRYEPNTSVRETGRRLALALCNTAYAKERPVWAWPPPTYTTATVDAHTFTVCFAAYGDSAPTIALTDAPGCPGCCASGGGGLLQAMSAGLSWANATSLTQARPRNTPSSACITATFDPAASVREVRFGLSDGPPGCIALDASKLPPYPFIWTSTAARDVLAQPTSVRTPGTAVTAQDGAAPVLPPMGYNTWNR